MKFSLVKLAFAVSILSMADGSPTLTKRINDCGPSTPLDDYRDDSPSVADCERLSRNIAGDGSWKVNLYDGWRKLATYGSCAFSAVSPWGELGGWVGNEDIRDLIRDSIRMWARNGKVGAHGEMECQAAWAVLEWRIHRN